MPTSFHTLFLFQHNIFSFYFVLMLIPIKKNRLTWSHLKDNLHPPKLVKLVPIMIFIYLINYIIIAITTPYR